MKLSSVFIQLNRFCKLNAEEQLVYDYSKSINLPIVFYTLKDINRRRLNISNDTLVVGDIACIYGALKQLDCNIPEINDYPDCLKHLFYRRISLKYCRDINFFPVFIKPAKRLKKFTGFVANSPLDLHGYINISRNELLYTSDVVNFVSEWRIFVNNSKIVGIRPCPGSENSIHNYNLDEINEAVKLLGNEKSGYAIDFGVLENNNTALIEVNDGFSIGAYGLDSKNYFEILSNRWNQIINN